MWAEYLATRDVELRNVLMEHYQYLATQYAASALKRLPKSVEHHDLAADGTLGLAEAIERYDPSQNGNFAGYAFNRIRGAILDGLRELDWVPRLTRRRAAKLEAAREKLRHRWGREPTREQVRRELGLGRGEFDLVAGDDAPAPVGSLSKLVAADGTREVSVGHLLADRREPAVGEPLARAEMLGRILRRVPRHMRFVLQLYYGQRMTMREVGRAMGISESRVSQIHAEALPYVRQMATDLNLSETDL